MWQHTHTHTHRVLSHLSSRMSDELEELDLEPMSEADDRARAKRLKPGTTTLVTPPAMTDQMLHVFFTVVLPTVFEWCALSDFFMPDEVFHDYLEESTVIIDGSYFLQTRKRAPFSVARAVCKDWFAVLYKRVYRHPMRMDYDVRLLRSNTGGIMHNGQVMLRMWTTTKQLEYLESGGTSVAEAYESGVELNCTHVHYSLIRKFEAFLGCEALRDLAKSTLPWYTPHVQLRRIQIVIGKNFPRYGSDTTYGTFIYVPEEKTRVRSDWFDFLFI